MRTRRLFRRRYSSSDRMDCRSWRSFGERAFSKLSPRAKASARSTNCSSPKKSTMLTVHASGCGALLVSSLICFDIAIKSPLAKIPRLYIAPTQNPMVHEYRFWFSIWCAATKVAAHHCKIGIRRLQTSRRRSASPWTDAVFNCRLSHHAREFHSICRRVCRVL